MKRVDQPTAPEYVVRDDRRHNRGISARVPALGMSREPRTAATNPSHPFTDDGCAFLFKREYVTHILT